MAEMTEGQQGTGMYLVKYDLDPAQYPSDKDAVGILKRLNGQSVEVDAGYGRLIRDGLRYICTTHGQDGEREMSAFHDLSHTVEVVHDGLDIVDASIAQGSIPDRDMSLLELKAIIALGLTYHDVDFDGGGEMKSWEFVKTRIEEQHVPVNSQGLELLRQGILATRIVDFQTLAQDVVSPEDTIQGWVERVYADADLAHFLRDPHHKSWHSHEIRGNRWYRETRARGKISGVQADQPYTVDELIRYHENQRNFLGRHHFYFEQTLGEFPPYERMQYLETNQAVHTEEIARLQQAVEQGSIQNGIVTPDQRKDYLPTATRP